MKNTFFIIGLLVATAICFSHDEIMRAKRHHARVQDMKLLKAQQCGNRAGPAPITYEFGRVNIDHQIHTVNFERTYENPVVILGALSANGGHPSTVRVTEVREDSFDLQIHEYSYLDVWHTTESISYGIFEEGNHEFADGTRYQAGYSMIDPNVGSEVVSVDTNWLQGNFVAFATIQTQMGEAAQVETDVKTDSGTIVARFVADSEIDTNERFNYFSVQEKTIEDDAEGADKHITTEEVEGNEWSVDFGYSEYETQPYFFAQAQNPQNCPNFARYRDLDGSEATCYFDCSRNPNIDGRNAQIQEMNRQETTIGYAAFW